MGRRAGQKHGLVVLDQHIPGGDLVADCGSACDALASLDGIGIHVRHQLDTGVYQIGPTLRVQIFSDDLRLLCRSTELLQDIEGAASLGTHPEELSNKPGKFFLVLLELQPLCVRDLAGLGFLGQFLCVVV